VSASTWRREMAQCEQVLHVVQKQPIDEIYASLNGALGLDDVELLSAKQIRLTGELLLRVACVFTGISNFRYMVGLFHCLQC